MPRYLINSHICAQALIPELVQKEQLRCWQRGKIKDIEAKACYCCTDEKRVAFVVGCPDQHTVLEIVQQQLDIPVSSIMEVQEVT